MRLLLDTQVLLWAVGMSHRLSSAARRCSKTRIMKFFTVQPASGKSQSRALWAGKISRYPVQLLEVIPAVGFVKLPVRARQAVEVIRLAPFHKDPFYRMLVAQSRVEPLILLTNDEQLASYGEGVRLIQHLSQ